MNYQIIPVKEPQKPILRRLLELYSYDFSEYTLEDLNEHGLYAYEYLDYYWTEPNRYAFFIKIKGKYAGFILINQHGDIYQNGEANCISEFFIMRKYRRQGIGKNIAHDILQMFPGKWEVSQHLANIPSMKFWEKTLVEKYNPEVIHLDSKNRRVFIFDV